ncbi:unnamed protein product [Brugia timori]|uniref:Uncharacterized protein n=1 Tax=Brugia timori TaxID=42155 RepID=A0A3P7W8V2_9BILA|nr:unnamed protein product [Brugia timori]
MENMKSYSFNNKIQILGGDPFENDKEWIPAHRLCTTKCDIHVDICMKNVKSDKQRCQKCLHFFFKLKLNEILRMGRKNAVII